MTNQERLLDMTGNSETQFQLSVIEYAKLHGWRVAHFRVARTARGWRTPVQADGAGFPDLIMTRRGCSEGRLVIAELKSKKGKVSKDQRLWLDAFTMVENVEVYVWRPEDRAEIEEVLR